MADNKRGLGRGLSALLGDGASAGTPTRAQRQLPVGQLVPSPLQPRRHFDADELEALAESIRANGILQPILVRRHPTRPEIHEIVAGERRWRAAQLAKLHEVPVIVRELGNREVLELALVENLQRHDLSALEEAEGYHRLIEEFGLAADDLARQVGKSRAHVANTLRLLKLPDGVKALLMRAEGLSVRQTEALAARSGVVARPKKPAPAKDSDTRALERDLARTLGLNVDIAHRGQTGGTLSIRYATLEQLDDLIGRLNRQG